MPYEHFDHTADLGFRIRNPQLPGLFEEAAECLFAAIIEDPATIQPIHVQKIEIVGTDRDFLLFDWLRDLLFRYDSEHWLFCRFQVTLTESGLQAEIAGEPQDPDRHHLSHEVKAITYHELKLVQTSDGWLAEIIVDI